MRSRLLGLRWLTLSVAAAALGCASGAKDDPVGTQTSTTTHSGGHGGSTAQGGGGAGGAGGLGTGGSGACAGALDGTPCGDPGEPECDLSACAAGQCVPSLAALDAPCGSAVDTECDPADGCDGQGACETRIAASGASCGDTTEATCDHADSCDGQGACLDNLEAASVPCGSAADTTCTDPDSCDGAGVCLAANAADGLVCDDCQAGPGQCTVCGAGVCLGNCAAGALTTLYANNNGFHGNMFDIVALTNVTISSFDANLAPGGHQMEIYYRPGTWVGFDLSSAGWTLAGTAAVNSAAADQPTPVPIAVNVSIPAGQRYAFYVTTGGTSMEYTDGTAVGNVAAQNADLQVLEGNGNQYPFMSGFTPRIWNGTVHYDACP